MFKASHHFSGESDLSWIWVAEHRNHAHTESAVHGPLGGRRTRLLIMITPKGGPDAGNRIEHSNEIDRQNKENFTLNCEATKLEIERNRHRIIWPRRNPSTFFFWHTVIKVLA